MFFLNTSLKISPSSSNTKDNIINELLNSILKILDNCKDKSIICKNKSVITYNIKKLLTNKNKKLKIHFDYEFLSNIKEQISNYEYINSIASNLRGIIAENENLLLKEYNYYLKKIK